MLPLACAAALCGCHHENIRLEQPAQQAAPAQPAAQSSAQKTDVCAGLEQPQVIAAKAASLAASGDFAKAYAAMNRAAECGTPASENFRYADMARYALLIGKYADAEKYAGADRAALSAARRFLLEGVELRDGAFVMASVTPQAQAAGLRENDEITAVRGGFAKGMTLEQFRAAVTGGKPGEMVPLAVTREGSSARIRIRLPIMGEDDGRADGVEALAKYFQDDLRAASKIARKALEQNPRNQDAATALALVKADADETPAALKLAPDDAALGTLARAYAYAAKGKTYPAVDAYSTIDPLFKDGGLPPVMELRGRISTLVAADRAQAQQDGAALEEKRNYRGEFMTLVLIARMPGTAEEVAKARDDMFAFAAKYPKAAALSKQVAELAAAGEESSKKEDFAAALPPLRKAALLAPWSAEVRCAFAVALAKTGDFAHARYHAELCAAAGPDNSDAAGLSAKIDLWEKEWHPAEQTEKKQSAPVQPSASSAPAAQPAADADDQDSESSD